MHPHRPIPNKPNKRSYWKLHLFLVRSMVGLLQVNQPFKCQCIINLIQKSIFIYSDPNTKQYRKLLPCEPRMFWDSFTDHWQRLHHAMSFHNDDISSMNSIPLNIFICDFLLWYDAEMNNKTNYINFRSGCHIIWTVALSYLTPYYYIERVVFVKCSLVVSTNNGLNVFT